MDARLRIRSFVDENPGSHLREIGRRCGLSPGTVYYHLQRMEANGDLAVTHDGRYKRFFPQGLDAREKELLSAFRHELPRRIGTALLTRPSATQRELSQIAGVARSTLSAAVGGMVLHGVLRRERAHPEDLYALEARDLAWAVLAKYGFPLAEPPRAVDAAAPSVALAGGT